MIQILTLAFLLATCAAVDFHRSPFSATRSTVPGIAGYRSALTLDWLAGEDSRQRQLVEALEAEGPVKPRMRADCMAYSRPSSGKVARLMLELLMNLEGDNGTVIQELTEALIRAKLLVETSMLEAEPDLEALVQTPGVMMGEPHATFPRILAITWLVTTDPVSNKKSGWCSVKQLTRYLAMARPVEVAKQMRALDPIVARARYIMDEFIQNVTPLNMYPDFSAARNQICCSRALFTRQLDLPALLTSLTEKNALRNSREIPVMPNEHYIRPPPAEYFLDPLAISDPRATSSQQETLVSLGSGVPPPSRGSFVFFTLLVVMLILL